VDRRAAIELLERAALEVWSARGTWRAKARRETSCPAPTRTPVTDGRDPRTPERPHPLLDLKRCSHLGLESASWTSGAPFP
jgi:hypothetical protein